MPLGPKPQPPYYTAEPMPTPPINGTYTRQNTQLTTEVTTGTTETDLYTYTIPANTLTENGDTLYIQFAGVTTGATPDWTIRMYLAGASQQAALQQQTTQITWRIMILKLSDTTARMTFWITGIDGAETQQAVQDELVDFTQTMTFKMTGQCTDAGSTIQTYYLTIDKMTI